MPCNRNTMKDSIRKAARKLFPLPSRYLELEVHTFEYWRYSSIARNRYTPTKDVPVGDALYDLGFISREASQHRVGKLSQDLVNRLTYT